MKKLTIHETKQKYEKKLMGVNGVIGVGLGKEGEDEVIVVLTNNLSEKARKKIPTALADFKVITRETGRIEAQ